MTTLVLDGKMLSKKIEEELIPRVTKIKEKMNGKAPILATILVGNDPSSATYVKMKGNACERVGMASLKVIMPQETTTEELLNKINELNANRDVHGILLQHPVPGQIDERACFDRIAIEKDVDGVTALGFGKMALGETAFGLLHRWNNAITQALWYFIKGKEAVVVGRSPILGKPLAMMFLNEHATVTICHSRTQNLKDIVSRAVVVVGAVGKRSLLRLIGSEMVQLSSTLGIIQQKLAISN
jgi:methylenetetrahydrofolate dehydrogenase (NADP+)/methenyltetrahydrofolate cyclohydrolase